MAAKTKMRKVRNEACYQAMVEKRRSSAAQPHTPKPRKGTRSAHKRNAVNQGW